MKQPTLSSLPQYMAAGIAGVPTKVMHGDNKVEQEQVIKSEDE